MNNYIKIIPISIITILQVGEKKPQCLYKVLMINVFKLAWNIEFQIWKIKNITSIGFTIHAKDMMFQWCLVIKNWIAMSSSLIFVKCMHTLSMYLK